MRMVRSSARKFGLNLCAFERSFVFRRAVPLHSKERWGSRQALWDTLSLLGSESYKIKSVSLSHTRGASVCASAFCGSVGVDIERATRKLSKGVRKRVFTSNELKLGLMPIELWTIKEAAYKAACNKIQRAPKDLWVASIEVSKRGAVARTKFSKEPVKVKYRLFQVKVDRKKYQVCVAKA